MLRMKKRRGGVECQTALSNIRGDEVTGVSQCGLTISEMMIRALKRDREEYPRCETNAMTRRE